MNNSKLKDMVNGWFIGAFKPTAYETNACEVAVKSYKAGDHDQRHYHKVATEISLVFVGKIRMLDKDWESGDIIVVKPGEMCEFTALTDTTMVVVKLPGVLGDKYIAQ